MLTGQPTDDTVRICVECEQVWIRESYKKSWVHVAFALIHSFSFFGFVFGSRNRQRKEFGRDTLIWIPIRVCGDEQRRLRRMNPRELRRVLETIPICAKLLDEYREARVSVE
jgi:hypothetical protein